MQLDNSPALSSFVPASSWRSKKAWIRCCLRSGRPTWTISSTWTPPTHP